MFYHPTVTNVFVIKTAHLKIGTKLDLLVSLHDVLKWSQEFLLEFEVWQLALLQKFHRQLTQRVDGKECYILIGITSNLELYKITQSK